MNWELEILAQTSRALAQGRTGEALALAATVAVDACPGVTLAAALAQSVVQTAVLLTADDNERPTLAQVQMRLGHMEELVALSTSPAVRRAWIPLLHFLPSTRRTAIATATACVARWIAGVSPEQARRAGLAQAVAEASVALATATQTLSDFDEAHGSLIW